MKNAIVTLNARRSSYNMSDAALSTMTVGELISYLKDFDEDSPIILSHDEGYTFGEIKTYDIKEEELNEEED